MWAAGVRRGAIPQHRALRGGRGGVCCRRMGQRTARWVAILLVGAMGAGVVALVANLRNARAGRQRAAGEAPAAGVQAQSQPGLAVPGAPGRQPAAGVEPGPPAQPVPADDPVAALKDAGVIAGDETPQRVVERIGRAIETGDAAAVERLIGPGVLSDAQRARLRQLIAGSRLRLRETGPVREVGEIEVDRLARWALEFDAADGAAQPLYFDLRREGGKWRVERVTLPEDDGGPPRALLADSLGIADLFAQAALRQDFELAREFVDAAQVSDAQIAALCILFEEGGYRLRERKPLRRLFERGGVAGFLAQIDAVDGSHGAQFGLTLRQPAPAEPWRVTEINLDTLLEDYARRVAGGDVYYTPLVRNPQGGDTLVLYFEFDQHRLDERTARQLEIVARILRSDTAKKIHISGHTDALGTEDYNQQLSARRARVVRDHLVAAGVDAGQVVTEAMGPSRPRRPNALDDGSDNPSGRRANRRSEIYLDF